MIGVCLIYRSRCAGLHGRPKRIHSGKWGRASSASLCQLSHWLHKLTTLVQFLEFNPVWCTCQTDMIPCGQSTMCYGQVWWTLLTTWDDQSLLAKDNLFVSFWIREGFNLRLVISSPKCIFKFRLCLLSWGVVPLAAELSLVTEEEVMMISMISQSWSTWRMNWACRIARPYCQRASTSSIWME